MLFLFNNLEENSNDIEINDDLLVRLLISESEGSGFRSLKEHFDVESSDNLPLIRLWIIYSQSSYPHVS